MSSRAAIIVLLVFLIISTTACTSKLAYNKNFGDPASPEDKNFVFSLRDSTILILPPEAVKKTDADNKTNCQSVDKSPGDVCQELSKDKKNGKTLPIEDIYLQCLSEVSVKAVAARNTSAFYAADPGYGTTVTSTAVDTDPFMVKSITVNYKNPAVGIVSSTGAGAVAGFGIGGPWGAVIGGALGAVGAVSDRMKVKYVIRPVPKPWYDTVCEEDKKEGITRFGELKGANDKVPQLFLPVALEYKTSASLTDCWHPLPNRSIKATATARLQPKDPLPLSGWFYRITLPDPPKGDPESIKDTPELIQGLPPVLPKVIDPNVKIAPPFQKRVEYFSKDDNKKSFPVSACRSVELHITWWEQLPKETMDPSNFKFYNYSMTVADSDYVQEVRLPKNGTISLLPVCGGYATPTQTPSSASELIDAAIKQAQAIKEAQSKYDSSSKK